MTAKLRSFYRTIILIIAASAAGDAKAWEVYDHSYPADTEVIAANPRRVQIYFTDPVAFKRASMVDAAGKDIPVRFGQPEDDTQFIEIWMPPDLGPGSYMLSWYVFVTAHGHADSGEIHFTIQAP